MVGEVVLQLGVAEHLRAQTQLFVEFVLLLLGALSRIVHLEALADLPVVKALVVFVYEGMSAEVELEYLFLHALEDSLDAATQLKFIGEEIELDESQPFVEAQKPLDEDVDVIDVVSLDVASPHFPT